MANRTVTWGQFQVRVVEPKDPARVTRNVVLSHGYGATGADLVPLAAMLGQSDPILAQRVRFLFPEAPYDLAEIGMPGGRAWWNLDVWKLQQAVASGTYRDLVNESPAELPATRAAFQDMLKQCAESTGVPLTRTILGGFSQGAMLSTDACLHAVEKPAGLIVWSGSLINQIVWRERMSHLKGLKVYQSHGKFDPILPFELAVQLRQELTAAGNTVTFLEFAGGHEIPYDAAEQTAQFLVASVADGDVTV